MLPESSPAASAGGAWREEWGASVSSIWAHSLYGGGFRSSAGGGREVRGSMKQSRETPQTCLLQIILATTDPFLLTMAETWLSK